jgi:hypothetical protein
MAEQSVSRVDFVSSIFGLQRGCKVLLKTVLLLAMILFEDVASSKTRAKQKGLALRTFAALLTSGLQNMTLSYAHFHRRPHLICTVYPLPDMF